MQRELMNLDMDYDKANKWINTCSDPVKKSSYLTSLNHIEDKRFRRFKRNNTNGRLDTNLTNLKSDLRQFIKGDYVSIDSKNSQPFLLSTVIDTIINNNSTLCCILSSSNLSKSFGVRALQKILLIHQKHLKHPFSPNLVNLSLFKKSTIEGAFYEGFMEQYGNGIERDKVKDIMFNVLFSEDKIYDKKNRWRDKDKDVFSSIYPFVFEVIKALKKKDHAMLAIFLQQLESYIFIDCIAKALVENGIIPFTIHDSLIVKSKDQIKALEIIKSVFEKQLGTVPSFHVKTLKGESIKPKPVQNNFLTKQIINWDKEILDLETFFNNTTLPTTAIKLETATTVTGVKLFVATHLNCIKNNNGKRTFKPYLNRLHQLKRILTVVDATQMQIQ